MNKRIAALGLITTVGMAAAALAAEAPPMPGVEKCIFQNQVNGWQVLDDSTLIVDAPSGSNRYLIKLFAPAIGLAFQENLAFVDGDHNGQLCSSGDRLVVGRPVPQSTPIIAVRLLSKDEVKALLDAKKAARRS
jgi:hypothetical protein